MPFGPNSLTTGLRPDLSEFFEFDTAMDRSGYIGPLVAPVINVALQSDNPGKVPIEALLANLDGTSTLHAGGAGYNRGDWEFERYSYATEEHGHEEPISNRDLKRYQYIIDAEKIAVERALHIVLGNQEKRVADMLFNPTTFASQKTTVTNEWDDFTNATPIDDVLTAVQAVYTQSGLDANAIWFNKTVFQNLVQCDQMQDVIASVGAGESYVAGRLVAAKLAEAFNLEHVFVAGGTTNSANEGQSASPGRIWSNEYAMVGVVNNSPDPRAPRVASTFHWDGDDSQEGGAIDMYWEDQTRGFIVRARYDTDEVIMYTEAAHLLDNITT